MERQGAPVDYISNIPQEIQMQIMNRLPHKDAIKTSALSTTWKRVWVHWKNRLPYASSLEFVPPYWSEDIQLNRVRDETERIQSYKNEKKKIEKYKMNFNPGDKHEKALMRIIGTSILCGVEILDLNFSQRFQSQTVNGGKLTSRRKKPELKEKIFEGNSIAHLSLAYCRINPHFRFTKFPHVQFMNFYGVNINEAKLEQLLRNCTALETLILTECFQLKNVRFTNFPILQLRNFMFVRCPQIERIQIITPNLRMFHFVGYLPEMISIRGNRLEEVVWISTIKMNYYHANNFWPIFLAESRIQRLTICNVGMQHFFAPRPDRPSPLHNIHVITFKLHQFWANDLMDFYRFLNRHNLPLLRSLNIEFPLCDPILPAHDRFNIVIIQEPAPQINFPNLFEMKMENFDGNIHQLSMLTFFLSRAASLLSVKLVLPMHFDMESSIWSLANIVTWVATTSRVSDGCIVVESQDGRFDVIP